MSIATVRVGRDALSILHELARAEGVSQQSIVECALKAYRRLRVLDATNAAFAALRADPAAWQEEEAERAAWDSTSLDGETRA